MDKEPVVSQLGLVEVKNNPAIAHIQVHDAIDWLYADVQSLRRPIKARLGGLGLFGWRGDPMVIIGLKFDRESSVELDDERKNIQHALDSIDGLDMEFPWRPQRPHISLGRILANTPRPVFRDLMDQVAAVVPLILYMLSFASYSSPDKQ
ncbi:hypothetical protein HY218_00535 [Candidatus Saccharibacteria bacterium]|nr:hypothetical protein [Candidatus Saccharibacteria bacterium]